MDDLTLRQKQKKIRVTGTLRIHDNRQFRVDSVLDTKDISQNKIREFTGNRRIFGRVHDKFY